MPKTYGGDWHDWFLLEPNPEYIYPKDPWTLQWRGERTQNSHFWGVRILRVRQRHQIFRLHFLSGARSVFSQETLAMTAKPKDSISFKWPKPTPTKQDAKPRNHDEDESESFCESSPFGRMAFLCFFAWWFVHTFLFAYKKKHPNAVPFLAPTFFAGFLDGSKAFTNDIQFFVHWCGAWFVVHRPKPVVLHGIFTWSSKVANGWKLHQMSTEAAKIHPTIHRMRTINMEDRPKKSIFISWIFPSKHTLCAFLLQLLLLFSHFHAFLSGKLGAGTTLSNIPTQHTSPQLALPETNSESPWKIVGRWLSF